MSSSPTVSPSALNSLPSHTAFHGPGVDLQLWRGLATRRCEDDKSSTHFHLVPEAHRHIYTWQSTRPLNRGAACLPCRKLKARCDGNKPACGRCLANGRPDDCEYAVGGEVTRSRLLEENVALLEARIRELENPNETTPSVRLHDPRRQDAPAAGSSRGAAPIAPNTQILVPGMPQLASPGSYAAPAQQEAQTLVQTFMAHASQLGLFMNPTRFMRAASLPRGAPGCLDDALMNAVYLWGSRLSSSNTLRGRETYFSANAVQAAAAGCALTPQPNGPVSNNVLYSAQTSVLLANYFLSAGRFLEGKYHWLAAVALVTGSKLHQLDIVALVGARMDPISIGERVHAFWTVFALDKAWSAAMNGPPSICQRGRAGILVTTPWPLATEAYEQGTILPSRGYNYSIHDFVRGAPIDESADDFSRLAIHAKAAALYESALYVSSQYRHDMPNRSEFLAQFTALDTHIEGFHRLLAGIRNRGPDDTRELLTSRTLVCVAAIQLHSAFAAQQSTSRQKSLGVAIAAARALDLVDLNQYRHLDSVVAMLWGTVARALLEEIRRLIQSAAPVRQEDVARITTSLDRVMGAMSSLAYNSPLMATQLSEIQQARASLN